MAKIPLFVCFWLVWSNPVQAEDVTAKAQANTLLKQGNRDLDRGKFKAALEKFQQAYQRFPSTKLFLNQGHALRKLGRNLEALATYQRFLAEAGDASPTLQDEARNWVKELTDKVGRLEVRSNRTEASVHIGDQDQGKTPLPGPVFVEPCEQQVALEWQGEKQATAVVAKAGEVTTVDVDFPVRPGQLALRINRAGASVQVDGAPVGQTPLVEPLSLAPGEHQVIVKWQGQQKTASIALAEGQTAGVDLNFPEPIVVTKPLPPAPPPPPTKWYRKSWVWLAAGAVVATVGVTTAIIYGHRDRYPSVNLGSQPIGD